MPPEFPLLQEFTLRSEDFIKLLILQAQTLRGRVVTGDGAFAFGQKRNPLHGVYFPLDAYTTLGSSIFSLEVGLKPAAEVFRVSWDAQIRALQAIESDPRLNTKEGIPPEEQIFIGVGVTRGKPGHIEAGFLPVIMPKLADNEAVRAISLNRVLRQLRANAKLNRVELPQRLAIPHTDPRHEAWRREIDALRKFGEMRFRGKLKARKTRAAAAATTFTIGTGP